MGRKSTDATRRLKGFRVLKGVEVDILEQGGLDLPDDVLAEANWVMASIHYGQNQPAEQITQRMIGAIENPYVTAISHPTGRMINRRKPYEIDLEAVFDAAVKHGKFMELNANPRRLDLNDVHCAAAKRHGIPHCDLDGCTQHRQPGPHAPRDSASATRRLDRRGHRQFATMGRGFPDDSTLKLAPSPLAPRLSCLGPHSV